MPDATTLPTVDDVHEARRALADRVVRTPTIRTPALDELVGSPVHAKLESLQLTGSFKVRGATNRLRTLRQSVLEAGLVTVSAGNAALGAAHAARAFGAPLTVVMPESAVPEKLAAVRGYGGRVVSEGVTSAVVAFERAAELVRDEGLTLLHPFDDPMVVAGAATATVELLEDAPEVRRLYVPCSGGGLLAGAVLAAQALGHPVEVVGVQAAGADGFVRSLAAGRPTAPPSIRTVADGLTAPQPGVVPFEVISRAGVQVHTVTDDQILDAMAELVRRLRVVIEPSAAVGLAGVLAEPGGRPPGDVGLLVSGSNVNAALLASVVERRASA